MFTAQVKTILQEAPRLDLKKKYVAEVIGITAHQLDEFLRDDSVTFRVLVNDARIERASALHGTVPQGELARQLGFSGKGIYKSFYNWRRRNDLTKFRQLDIRVFHKEES